MIAFAALFVQAVLIQWLLYAQRQRRRSEAEAHQLSGRLISAHEEERARVARELHDDVTQRLAVLAIEAGREEQARSGAASAAMTPIREGLQRLSKDVHALSYGLHPSMLEDLGLAEALQAECTHFAQTCPLNVMLNVDGVPEHVGRDVGLCLFRIAQESLRNIARHGSASSAKISVRPESGGLRLTVSDDGVGFDVAHSHKGSSLGLASMRQRVKLIGGKLDVVSKLGTGTRISAWVPMEAIASESSPRTAG
jgi:signal transduction histidine kinase